MPTYIETYIKKIDRIVCLDHDEKDFLKLLISNNVIPEWELDTLFELQHDYYTEPVGSLAEHLLMQKQAYLALVDTYADGIADYVAMFFMDDLDELYINVDGSATAA